MIKVNTIRRQIGTWPMGRVGAHNLVGDEESCEKYHAMLKFKVGGLRQTWIHILLNHLDTYDVQIWKTPRMGPSTMLASYDDVYCEQLGETVERIYSDRFKK